MTTILLISALFNILLAIWLFRALSRIARLEADALRTRTELNLERSMMKQELIGIRRAGL
jgi:hypothetical protein